MGCPFQRDPWGLGLASFPSRTSHLYGVPSTLQYLSTLIGHSRSIRCLLHVLFAQEATLVGLGAGLPATNNRDRAPNGKRISKAQPPAPLDLIPLTTCWWPRVSLRLWATLTSKPNVAWFVQEEETTKNGPGSR